MRRITGLLGMFVVLSVGALAPASAIDDDIHAGVFLTIDVEDEYSAGVPLTVSGYLLASIGLVIEEASRGIADQQVEILVNGSPVTSVVTAGDGKYEATLTFDGAPPAVRSVQAAWRRGEVLETRSRTAQTRLDRLWTELEIVPGSVTLGVGETIALRAFGTDEDGRRQDLTDRVGWVSSNTSVATVTGGLVTGVTVGSTNVTATLYHLQAQASVTVSS